MASNIPEIERIKRAYEFRDMRIPQERYSYFNAANLFMLQGIDRVLLEILATCGLTSLAGKRVLDVGCGNGDQLSKMVMYGIKPENAYGIDLLPSRIDSARVNHPLFSLTCGDASQLPYEKDYFDIVMQITVFTSILDKDMQKAVAGEMLRVLRPEGVLLWYDFHCDNPFNPDVKGVKKSEIQKLFPGTEITFKRVTLAPPLLRLLAPFSLNLCHVLESFKILNTHYWCIIRKIRHV